MAEEKIVAFCGLACSECPAYRGTQAGDEELLAQTAEQWSGEGYELTAADVICDGCTTGGKRLASCTSYCKVRVCARAKESANCAYCDDYACAELKRLWEIVESEAPRRTLDDLRREVKRL